MIKRNIITYIINRLRLWYGIIFSASLQVTIAFVFEAQTQAQSKLAETLCYAYTHLT